MNAKTKGAFRNAALAGLCALVGTMAFPAGKANATTITYNLTTKINPGFLWYPGSLTPVPNYGTVTYTDHGNSIDVTIDLAKHSDGASYLEMNYDPSKFGSANEIWSVSGDANSIAADENSIDQSPSAAGNFDIVLSKKNPKGQFYGDEPYSFTISLKRGGVVQDLSVFDFNFKTAAGLYNAVYVDCDPVWVGSTVATVPEPASLALLGVGMLGTVVMTRRRQAAAAQVAG